MGSLCVPIVILPIGCNLVITAQSAVLLPCSTQQGTSHLWPTSTEMGPTTSKVLHLEYVEFEVCGFYLKIFCSYFVFNPTMSLKCQFLVSGFSHLNFYKCIGTWNGICSAQIWKDWNTLALSAVLRFCKELPTDLSRSVRWGLYTH